MTREIASRLSGGDGASVTEVQTPFGGGKTHAMLTFYHLVNSPSEATSIPEVQEVLGGFSIPSNAKVLVFDGQEYGTDSVTKENGVTVSTMWGELTSQVDAGLYRRLIMDSDGKGEAPGNGVFRTGAGGSIALPDSHRRSGQLPSEAEILQQPAYPEPLSPDRPVLAGDAATGRQRARRLRAFVVAQEPPGIRGPGPSAAATRPSDYGGVAAPC